MEDKSKEDALNALQFIKNTLNDFMIDKGGVNMSGAAKLQNYFLFLEHFIHEQHGHSNVPDADRRG